MYGLEIYIPAVFSVVILHPNVTASQTVYYTVSPGIVKQKQYKVSYKKHNWTDAHSICLEEGYASNTWSSNSLETFKTIRKALITDKDSSNFDVWTAFIQYNYTWIEETELRRSKKCALSEGYPIQNTSTDPVQCVFAYLSDTGEPVTLYMDDCNSEHYFACYNFSEGSTLEMNVIPNTFYDYTTSPLRTVFESMTSLDDCMEFCLGKRYCVAAVYKQTDGCISVWYYIEKEKVISASQGTEADGYTLGVKHGDIVLFDSDSELILPSKRNTELPCSPTNILFTSEIHTSLSTSETEFYVESSSFTAGSSSSPAGSSSFTAGSSSSPAGSSSFTAGSSSFPAGSSSFIPKDSSLVSSFLNTFYPSSTMAQFGSTFDIQQTSVPNSASSTTSLFSKINSNSEANNLSLYTQPSVSTTLETWYVNSNTVTSDSRLNELSLSTIHTHYPSSSNNWSYISSTTNSEESSSHSISVVSGTTTLQNTVNAIQPTSSAAFANQLNSFSCNCLCTTVSLYNVNANRIDKKSLSSYKRQLTCAPDGRLSSMVLGVTGILVISVTISLFVLSDLANFIVHMRKKK